MGSKYYFCFMTELQKADLFEDYKLICQMKVPDIYLRTRLLSELLGATPDPWCVVGITPAALEVFSKHDFRRASRMGVNRAHINKRFVWLREMLEGNFSNPQEWWDFYTKNDNTILATSSENNQKVDFNKVEIIEVPSHLFRRDRYAWRDGKEERDFLREEYNKRLAQ